MPLSKRAHGGKGSAASAPCTLLCAAAPWVGSASTSTAFALLFWTTEYGDGPFPKPSKKCSEICAVIDAGSQWELDLETFHGLTDKEACMVVLIASTHMKLDEFPPSKGS
eukprot:scaffold165648_cov53-Attheya_sp.AAC.1